jgi:hypothetical protein
MALAARGSGAGATAPGDGAPAGGVLDGGMGLGGGIGSGGSMGAGGSIGLGGSIGAGGSIGLGSGTVPGLGAGPASSCCASASGLWSGDDGDPPESVIRAPFGLGVIFGRRSPGSAAPAAAPAAGVTAATKSAPA